MYVLSLVVLEVVAERFRLVNLLRLLWLVVAPIGVCSSAWAQVEQEVPEPPKPVEAEESLSIEDILSAEVKEDDYRKTERCINTRKIRKLDVLSDRIGVFEMRDDKLFLMTLKHRCLGMRRNATYNLEQRRTASFCKGDDIRFIDPAGLMLRNWGPPCDVPGFEEVTEGQVQLLKEGIKSGRIK